MAEPIIRPRSFPDTATDSDLQNDDNYLWLDTANKAKKVEITRLAVVGETAATESDLVAGSTLPIMTANGPKSLPGNAIAGASEQAALTTYVQNVAHSIAPEYNGTTGAVAGRLYMNGGILYRCKEDVSGEWDATKFYAIDVKDVIAEYFEQAKNEDAGEAHFTAVSGSAILVQVKTEINPGDKFLVRVVGDDVANALNLRTQKFWQTGNQYVERLDTLYVNKDWIEVSATQSADCITLDLGSASASGELTLQVVRKNLFLNYIFDNILGIGLNGKVSGETSSTITSGSAIYVDVPIEVKPGDKILVRVVGDAVTNALNLRLQEFWQTADQYVQALGTVYINTDWVEVTASYEGDKISIDRGSASASGNITLQVISKNCFYRYIFDDTIDVILNGKVSSVSLDLSGAATGYYYNSTGTLVSNASSSYKEVILTSDNAGKRLVVEVGPNEPVSSRYFVLLDDQGNIKKSLNTGTLINSYNRTYSFGVVPQNGWKLRCSWLTTGGIPTITSITSETLSLKESIEKTTLYVSSTGNDTNDGSELFPKKTVNGAINAGASCVIVKSGVYNDVTINTNVSVHDKITIKGERGGRVIFKNANALLKADGSEQLETGYSNVYKISLNTAPYSDSSKWLFFDGCDDTSTAINVDDAHPLERGLYYRCDCTKSVRASSDNLSDALAEIESAEVYKWYYDSVGKVLYFNRPGSTETYPLYKSMGIGYFICRENQSLVLSNIEFRYAPVNLINLNVVEVLNCAAKYVHGAGAFMYDGSISVIFDHCEASCAFGAITGDGFNGHNASDSAPAKASQITLRECWSHDNNDDGYSDHEYAETTVDGGLYEYNGKGGVTPSYGSHCVAKNVTSRYNLHGFLYLGPVQEGNGGQMMCYGCVSIGHKSKGGDGYVISGAGDRAILVNCKSINDRYAFNCGTGCFMDVIDCGYVDATAAVSGSGTITKTKTATLE